MLIKDNILKDSVLAMNIGEIAWFNTAFGYGFIDYPDGRQVFFHHSVIRDKENKKKALKRGDSVRYSYVRGHKGLKAVSVELSGTNTT